MNRTATAGRSARQQGLRAVTAPVLLLALAGIAWGATTGSLISRDAAHQLGLERAWFAHAQVDPSHSSVERWILSGDQLILVSDSGTVHAIDADTGQTLWTSAVGNPHHPSLGPGVNDRYVALVNGSKLYLLDRSNGRLQHEREVRGAPGAGPELSRDHVFVPLINGQIEGYRLDDQGFGQPWYYKSFGRIMVPPRVTDEHVVWATDAGYLYVGQANGSPNVRFRLEAPGKFSAQPAYQEPLIYAVTLDGELFAVDERLGRLRWRYVTGFPTDRAPAVVDDRVYLTTDEPALHAIDADTGAGQWEVPGIAQFAAVAKEHVYGIDRFGTFYVLDRQDGAILNRIATDGALSALVNDQTDRLLLISKSGLVQCLHEIGADKPTYYVDLPEAMPEEQAPDETAEPSADEESPPPTQPDDDMPPAEEAEPFAPRDDPDDDAPRPLGAPDDDSTFGTDDNPFAF